MARVLVVDDHAVVRRGLIQILAEERDIEELGEAGSAHELLELIEAEDWDIVVLDITMPGKSGIDVLKDIRSLRPGLPVLVLSIHPEDRFAIRALRAGAAGYITKDSASDEIIRAIRTVLGGGKYLSPAATGKLASFLERDSEKPLHVTLSDREFQVMVMIASGKTVGDVAKELCLSDKTVSTYRARVLSKLDLKNNMELTRYAIRNRLID
ncbi:MAG: response regulator transcription factor [Actinobacteria bacterium]|nr:response regulator transcription factor [Actinomycetota bacterium]